MNRDQFLAKGRMRQVKQEQARQAEQAERAAAVPVSGGAPPVAGADDARRPPRAPDPKMVGPGRRP